MFITVQRVYKDTDQSIGRTLLNTTDIVRVDEVTNLPGVTCCIVLVNPEARGIYINDEFETILRGPYPL